MTVPWPFIPKQWSTANKNGPSLFLEGTKEKFDSVSMSLSRPIGFKFTFALGCTAISTIGAFLNFVCCKAV